VQRADDLAQAVAAFLGSRMRADYAPALGRQLHAAVKTHHPQWAPELHDLKRALKGWERARPVVKRPPLVWPLAVAMALFLTQRGYPACGVAVVLGHHAYLRIGELLGARVEDVVLAHVARMGYRNAFAFLNLPKTKAGVMQDVELWDSDVAWLVAVAARAAPALAAHADDPGKARLFPVSEHTFRKRFAAAAAAWGLPPTITPHSLRHGGATDDHVTGRLKAAEIRARGRWQADKSMAHYIGAMRGALATMNVPETAVRTGATLAKRLRRAFAVALARAPQTEEVRVYAAAALATPANAGAVGVSRST
jgi:integrase